MKKSSTSVKELSMSITFNTQLIISDPHWKKWFSDLEINSAI